jgi:hypothetical protein
MGNLNRSGLDLAEFKPGDRVVRKIVTLGIEHGVPHHGEWVIVGKDAAVLF